jgi:hypothetical protein
MKFRTAILAAALVATSGYAFAQNTTTPADQNRPGMQGDDSSKQKDTIGNKGAGTHQGLDGARHHRHRHLADERLDGKERQPGFAEGRRDSAREVVARQIR